jgi:uncharacterized protein YjbJ (UPF0337 family)
VGHELRDRRIFDKESIMNEYHVKEALTDVAGRVQSAAGAFADDPATELKGKARQASARLEGAYGDAVDAVTDARQSVGRVVQANPMAAILTAVAVGYVLGWALHRD